MAKEAGSAAFNMKVAVHNPSNIPMLKAEILVPKGFYTANGYNQSSGLMELPLGVELRCHHDYVEVNKVKSSVENCLLLVNKTIPARGMALFNVLCQPITITTFDVDEVFGKN
jgi:hypothetical protein